MDRQLKGTALAMSEGEREMFLRDQTICRIATVGRSGQPHVSALWFAWDGVALWLNSLVMSRRWADVGHDSRVSVIVDDSGTDFLSPRGVELLGKADAVGEVPRTGAPSSQLELAERLFMDKYGSGGKFEYDGRHAWLCVVPEQIVSWDYAKLRPSPSTLPSA